MIDSQEARRRVNQIECHEHGLLEEGEQETRGAFAQGFQKFYSDLLDDGHNKVTMDKLCATFLEGVLNEKGLKLLKEEILDFRGE